MFVSHTGVKFMTYAVSKTQEIDHFNSELHFVFQLKFAKQHFDMA